MQTDPNFEPASIRWTAPLGYNFHVLALKQHGKTPVGGWAQFRERTPTPAEICDWQNKSLNAGIVTGACSNLVVLDLDDEAALAQAEANGLPATARVRTPRGCHVYFRHPGYRIPNSTSIFRGADLRGDGGYVVAPGSRFVPSADEVAAGKLPGEYRWEAIPADDGLAPMPEWLLGLVRRPQERITPCEPAPQAFDNLDVTRFAAEIRNASNGTRNDTLNRCAYAAARLACADVSLDQDLIKSELAQAGLDAGLKLREVNATIESAWVAGIKDAEVDPTEDGVALQFSRTVGTNFLYDNDRQQWFRWDGNIWRAVHTNDVKAEIRSIARSVCKAQLRKGTAVSGAERLARCDPAHRPSGPWDNDPMLLGTPAGAVDLKTGQLRAAAKHDLITKQVSVSPISGAPKLWMSFLRAATGDDAGLIAFLQRMCGYILTGDTREQCLFFVYGQGGNGKSVFLSTVRSILHGYATAAPTETFTASTFDRHPAELAMLAGARMVSAAETEHGRPWAEARIKQLTGGDAITARFMRCDFFTYVPTFKLVIIGNHKPDLKDVDDALRRRILIIPFTRRPARPDLQLEQKLRDEYPQILGWMIEGTRAWLGAGLGPPPAVAEATSTYFADQDVVARWIEDRCDLDGAARTTPRELHIDWINYAQDMGYPLLGIKALGAALDRHGSPA